MLFLTSLAFAGDLLFTPDRPGIGDSTGTVGAGHVMIEGGLALTTGPTALGTSGLVGRFGVADGLELRARVPDVAFVPEVGIGTVGVGAKVAGSTGEFWSASVVPELSIDPDGGAIGGSVNSNVAFAYDVLGIWAHASAAADADANIGLFMGGGLSVALGSGGLYANGGAVVGGPSVGGGGAWFALSERFQIDAGCDVYGLGGDPIPVFGLGASAGF